MNTRMACLCVTMALGIGVSACRDSSVAPRPGSEASPRRPAFATTSNDTAALRNSHFVSNGDYAYAFWWFADSTGGYGSGYVNVSRGGPTRAPQTYLYYSRYWCDYYCYYSYGWGYIPNGDLSRQGASGLRLSTNTATNPDFYTYGEPGGLMELDWTPNGAYQFTQSGISNRRYGDGFTEHTQGSTNTASAVVSGTVLGVAVGPYASGEFGTNHSVTIDLYR